MNTRTRFPTSLLLLTAIGPLCAQESKPWSVAGTRDRQEAFLSHIADQRVANCFIQYGASDWRNSEAFGRGKGQRFPFGAGSWARLETNVPMTVGGGQIPPGLYCLALEHGEDGSWSLVLFEDAEIRQKKFIPLQTPQLKGMGSTYALTHEWVKEEAKSFRVSFLEGPDKGGEATLQVRWGNQLLSSPVTLCPRHPWCSGGRRGARKGIPGREEDPA